MPTQQPSNAPTDLPGRPHDDASAAAVLDDEQLDDPPGGGGLGGAAAADPLSGASGAPSGTSRNSPIDVATPEPNVAGGAPSAGAQREQREAAHQAVNTPPPESHPSSL